MTICQRCSAMLGSTWWLPPVLRQSLALRTNCREDLQPRDENENFKKKILYIKISFFGKIEKIIFADRSFVYFLLRTRRIGKLSLWLLAREYSWSKSEKSRSVQANTSNSPSLPNLKENKK